MKGRGLFGADVVGLMEEGEVTTFKNVRMHLLQEAGNHVTVLTGSARSLPQEMC